MIRVLIVLSLVSAVAFASEHRSVPFGPFFSTCELTLSNLPIATYQKGDTPITAGSRTGLLLVLKTGSVAIIKNGVQIAKVTEPGAIFGEISALLDKPHTADVLVLEPTEFYIANADVLMTRNPVALGYIGAILAGRLDAANETVVELKQLIEEGKSRSEIAKTVEKLEKQLVAPDL